MNDAHSCLCASAAGWRDTVPGTARITTPFISSELSVGQVSSGWTREEPGRRGHRSRLRLLLKDGAFFFL